MTYALYNTDCYCKEFDAKVISCEQDIKHEGKYNIILDRTAFFPEQGGQDSDTGIIMAEGIHAQIFHTSINNDIITHHSDTYISTGTNVHGVIDWEKRYDRMQQHSGEHLMSGYINSKYGFDNVGFHLGDTEVTLDFNGHFSDEMLSDIELEVNRTIYKNINSHIWFPDAEELASLPYRSKKELKGAIRIVEFPGYDICACCAPHVKMTGEIGQIKILNSEHLKGGTTRIYIACGLRALSSHISLLDSARSISRLLSVMISDVSPAVVKLKDNSENLRREKNELAAKLLYIKADEAISSSEDKNYISLCVENADTSSSREIVNYIAGSTHKYVLLFIGNKETDFRFMIGHENEDCAPLLSYLKERYSVKGGGKGTLVQGQISVNDPDLSGYMF